MDKDMRLRIEVTPLNFIAYPVTPHHIELIRGFAKGYVRWSEYWDKRQKRKIRTPLGGHIFFNHDRSEIRGIRTMLEELLEYLIFNGMSNDRDYYLKEIKVENDLSTCLPKMKDSWQLLKEREQDQVVEFCLDGKTPQKVITLQTGLGKSMLMMWLAKELNQRFIIIMRPFLSGEDESSGWMKDFYKTYEDISEKDILYVAGRENLVSLINLGLSGELEAKVIILSNKTLQNYINTYEQHTLEEFTDLKGYSCKPQDLPAALGVDTFFLDEVHFDYHLNCKMLSYFKLNHFFGATGTLEPDDPFVKKMTLKMFPDECRYKQKNYKVYIQPHAYYYGLKAPDKVRYMGPKGYSHIRFEKSVSRYVPLMRGYLDLIKENIETLHIPKLKDFPEGRCLIYCASIDMCTKVTEYVQKLYPDKKVRRFVEQDPAENLFNSDYAISTTFSAGTGQDIPNLMTVIMTPAISATQTTVQSMGRLRYIKDVPLDFSYFVCSDIKKHQDYDKKKRTDTLVGKALPIKSILSGKVI